MNRRNMLKVIPLAAMAGTTVNIGREDAQAYEMKPNKKYVFIVSDSMLPREAKHVRELLSSRGIDATIMTNVTAIYELE